MRRRRFLNEGRLRRRLHESSWGGSSYGNVTPRVGKSVNVCVISEDEWFECPLDWGTVEFARIDYGSRRDFDGYPEGTVDDIDPDYILDDDDDYDDNGNPDYDKIVDYIKKKYKAKKVYVVDVYEHSSTSYSAYEYTGRERGRIYAFTWSNDIGDLKGFWEDEMTSWANGTDMFHVQYLTNVSELRLLDNGEPVDGDEEDSFGGFYFNGARIEELFKDVSGEVGKCDYYYVENGYFSGLYDSRGKKVK